MKMIPKLSYCHFFTELAGGFVVTACFQMDSDQADQVEINVNGIAGFGLTDGAVTTLDEVVRNLHGVADFYRKDTVRHNKSGSIGFVISGCDGDVDEDDYAYDDDDGGCNERAKTENLETEQKQVRVLLDGKRKFWNVNDITLVDRMFRHGQNVAYVTDPTGQLGVVQDVDLSADLLAPDGSILKDVSTRDLECPFEFWKGDCVVLGPWVGTVNDMSLDVTVLADDGSSRKVINADPQYLVPTDKTFAYYPGQRVLFRKSRWLSSFWKVNPLEGTVTQVTVGSVLVNWIASSGYGPSCSTAPSKEQSPKKLKKFSCLGHACWRLGCSCFFRPSVLRSSSIARDSAKSEAQQRNGRESETVDLVANPIRKKEKFEQVYKIIKTNRKVSVLWQDTTMGHCIDSKLLFKKVSNDFDLVAQQFVLEKAHNDISETRRRRCGVIQSVNSKERTACVRWLEDPGEFDTDEIVSVYELEGHPDYNYRIGYFVCRFAQVYVAKSTIEKHNGGEIPSSADVSSAGIITGLKNGDIEVTWADGMVSTVGPREIFVVDGDNANQDESIALYFGIALSLVLAPIDFVTRLAVRLFSWRMNVHDISRGDVELQCHGTTNINDCGGRKGDNGKALITSNASEEGSCNLQTERLEAAPLNSDDQTTYLKRFDAVKDPSDHHFLGTSGKVNSARRWLKKVQQDWSILEKNLPDGIYVRVYEDRMDLIRAVIVGPSGTPYQDGLFFFDFDLAPPYPYVPPLVYYHSGGWKINPNLYANGHICLSLLNTWDGNTNETWNPTSSSILQVLVSLQGLVLNSKPYFNEAGYDKHVGTFEGEKNSLEYNENTFLLNCKAMMYLMRRPPKDFEELIKDHFKRRGWYILKACDAYMRGSLIGSLSRDALVVGPEKIQNSNSVGFKLMLTKITPKLYSALTEVGADCAEFKHLLR